MLNLRALKYFILFILLQNLSFSQANVLALKIDSIFSKHKANKPGLCINIQQNDQLLYSNNFGADANKKPFDDFTVINVGDLGHSFISYAILILNQQGKLSLEDNLLKYFPEIKNKHAAQKIKVWHLLSHTSGLKDGMLSKTDSIAIHSGKIEVVFNYLNELDKEPGTEFNYATISYKILSSIISKVSNLNWKDFIKENIFTPTGMTFTKFNELESVLTNIVDLKKYVYALRYCLIANCETIKLSEFSYLPKISSENKLTYNLCWNFNAQITSLSDACIYYYQFKTGNSVLFYYFPEKEISFIAVGSISLKDSKKIMNHLKNDKLIK